MKKKIVIALAGNPNCGKSTLFNLLTGSSQYVGNWCGVTVEEKEGVLKSDSRVLIADLPGIYSLSPYTPEEAAAANFLMNEHADAVINIVDGTMLERGLFLTTQLFEAGIPMVVGINMADVLQKSGVRIDFRRLSKELGCPVFPISALKKTGISALMKAAVFAAENQTQQAKQTGFTEKAGFEHGSFEMSTDERYRRISSVLKKCVMKTGAPPDISSRIDRIVTSPALALPIFAAVMFLMYFVSVSLAGDIFSSLSQALFGKIIAPALENLLTGIGAAEFLRSLICEGIVGGIAAVIGFAPQLALMFFFLAVLEDCGYMARAAFIFEGIFRRFGLSGRSVIPYVVGSGCGVPAISACRTLENETDRRLTMITATLVPCSAKLPVIALLSGCIDGGWWAAPLMYFCGILLIFLSCAILKKTAAFSGEPSAFLIELPRYRLPLAKNLLIRVWERLGSFLKKAGTVIFLCSAAVWFLSNFGISGSGIVSAAPENSFLAAAGNAAAPIFAPLGFGNWRAVSAVITGFAAKEGVASTLAVLSVSGGTEAISAVFTGKAAALSFLMFNLFCSPCAAALSALAKEIGSKKFFIGAVLFQNTLAYCVSFAAYQLCGVLLGELRFGFMTVLAAAEIILLIFLAARRKK